MSLINDALKRAKEAQQPAAPEPASNLQLRPIEPGQCSRPALGLTLPFTFAVVALVVLLLAWQWTQRSNVAPALEVRGHAAAPAHPAPAPQLATAPVAPDPVAPVPVAEPAPASDLTPLAEPVPSAPVAISLAAAEATTKAPVATAPDSGARSTAAAIENPPPKLGNAKLQAIVFSRTRPSVMINGKTLFIGDKLNGYHVTAIDRDSVTLVLAGQTNVLTLPE